MNQAQVKTSVKVQEVPNGPFSIWRVPAAKLIRDALKCKICGNIGVPPNLQCRMGHILCSNHFETVVQPDGTKKYEQLIKCAVVNEMGGKQCNAYVYQANLDLYTQMFNSCFFNCPATDIGCEEKIQGSELHNHLLKCIYNNTKQCPNEYCGKRGILPNKFIEHLIVDDKVPIFTTREGSKIVVSMIDEMHKRGIAGRENEPFYWIAALLNYKENTWLMVVVRRELKQVSMWIHRIQEAHAEVAAETTEAPELSMPNQMDPDTAPGPSKADGINNTGLTSRPRLMGQFALRSELGLIITAPVCVVSAKKSFANVVDVGTFMFTVQRSQLSRYFIKGSAFDQWNLEVQITEEPRELVHGTG